LHIQKHYSLLVKDELVEEEIKQLEDRIINTAENLSLTETSVQHIKESVIRD